MTPLRFSMLTATLLAFAATVHGQAPAEPTCPGMSLPTWMAPYLQQTMQTWQQVRGLCTGQACDKGVCGSVAVGSPGCCKLGICVTGKAGCVKCCETVKAPAACCCVKACGCCESCKAKKDPTPQTQELRLPPPMANFGIQPTLPGAGCCMPPTPMPVFGLQTFGPPRPGDGGCPAIRYQPAPAVCMPPPLEAHIGSLMLGAGINCDNGVACNPVLNERNFDVQAERDLKIAEFYRRTGHPGAAQFYYELVARRYAPMPTMPAPYQTVQLQALPMPCSGPMAMGISFGYPVAPPMPMPPPPPLANQVVQVHPMAAQPMYMPPPPAVIHVSDCVVAAPAPKHAHLVTPDLEAHCLRMTHQGDKIILEGDVILVNKKHAQPIRIEAQRVVINMKDGSVTVESAGSTSGFGVQRTSAVAPVVERVQIEERLFKAIRLRNAQANDVAKLIAARLANGASRADITVQAEPISNSILLTASADYLESLLRIIADLDRVSHAPVRPAAIVVPGR